MGVLERSRDALDIFHYALQATRVERAMARAVTVTDGALLAAEQRYVLADCRRIVVVAIGKVAGPMAASFAQIAGSHAHLFEGIVAGHVEERTVPPQFRCYAGGHPVPNAASQAAADDALSTLSSLDEDDLVIFLVSGGGSSMLERLQAVPTDVAAIVKLHRALVGCGAGIAEINCVRKHLSAVKGGRLAQIAAPARQLTLVVSDVPPGMADAVASGPSFPDPSTVDDAQRIVDTYGLRKRMPASLRGAFASHALTETPKPHDVAFARSQWLTLLDSRSLAEAARVRAAELGWETAIEEDCDELPAVDAAERLLARVRAMRRGGRRTCLISAGEVTLRLPVDATGQGGRNQHFALLCSERIGGEPITVLSCGSDGIDGNSPAAGAVVDGTTLKRAQRTGHSVALALKAFDAYPLLAVTRDAICTGPTGNNLRDLRLLLAE